MRKPLGRIEYFAREIGKIVIKIFVVFFAFNFIRRVLVWFTPVNRRDAQNNILIVQLDNIGDVVLATSTLKYYKRLFQGKELYYLCDRRIGDLVGGFFDEIIPIVRKKFIYNVFYSARVISRLRKIGFSKVIHHNTIPFSAIEYSGAYAFTGAEEVIGYEGERIFLDTPPIDLYEFFVIKLIWPLCRRKFTRLIPSIDKNTPQGDKRITPAIAHFAAIYEALAGRKESDYSTTLAVPDSVGERMKDVPAGDYCVIGPGAAVGYRQWPIERFVRLAEFLNDRGIGIVLAGSPSERHLGERFRALFPAAHDVIGKTSIEETARLIKGSLLCISNDTSFVHMAIAQKIPTLCILGGGHWSRVGFYGYPDINKWIFDENAQCLGDNWACGKRFWQKGKPAPCVASISAEQALKTLEGLVGYIAGRRGHYPVEPFTF